MRCVYLVGSKLSDVSDEVLPDPWNLRARGVTRFLLDKIIRHQLDELKINLSTLIISLLHLFTQQPTEQDYKQKKIPLSLLCTFNTFTGS